MRKIDVPTKQVLIEARIVVADQDFSGQIGGSLGLSLNNTQKFFGSSDTTVNSSSKASTGLTSATQTSGGGLFSLALTHNPTGQVLSLALTALELDDRGKVISSPRVVTMDQQKATIKQGMKVPYQSCSTSGSGTTSTSTCTTTFQDVNLSLDVTPQITPDNKVNLLMQVNKDTLGTLTDAGYIINTNQVNTQALLANGETTVIGGIFEENKRTDISKTPLLGDIPVFGYFFKNKSTTDKRAELMIFVTPKILDERLTVR